MSVETHFTFTKTKTAAPAIQISHSAKLTFSLSAAPFPETTELLLAAGCETPHFIVGTQK